jgi:Holliday junction resolvase RusA-like endonuclease
MTDITLDLPLPPSVNKIRRIDWAEYRGYKRWQKDADKTLMLHKQNKQRGITGAFKIIIDIDYDALRADPSNVLKALEDYCVSRHFVPDDRKRFLKGINIQFADNLPEGCRVTIASV